MAQRGVKVQVSFNEEGDKTRGRKRGGRGGR